MELSIGYSYENCGFLSSHFAIHMPYYPSHLKTKLQPLLYMSFEKMSPFFSIIQIISVTELLLFLLSVSSRILSSIFLY